jgi:hypothetical protein
MISANLGQGGVGYSDLLSNLAILRACSHSSTVVPHAICSARFFAASSSTHCKPPVWAAFPNGAWRETVCSLIRK